MNFTYDPNEFAVNMDMIMDGNPVFSNTFSGNNDCQSDYTGIIFNCKILDSNNTK